MQTQLLTPTLPEGYTVRPATLDDAAAVLDLLNAVSLAEVNAAEYDLDELISDWQSPRFTLSTDTRLIHDADGQLVAVGIMWMTHQPPVRVYIEVKAQPGHPHLPAFYHHLLTWGEGEAHRAIPLCPPDSQVVMTGGAHVTNPLALEMHRAHGMAYKRTFYMMEGKLDAPPPAPTWPDGVTIRTMRDTAEGPMLYAAIDDMFSEHYGHIADPDLQNYPQWAKRHFSKPTFDPSLWFLAEAEGEIVGMIWCLRSVPEDENMAFVNIVGVRRDWRKHGMGLNLLYLAFDELYRRGATRVALNVDASNSTGATRLYERAGMWAERIWDSYEKELRPGAELYSRK